MLDTKVANQPPVADDDAATTDEDTAVVIDVLDGDTDADGTIAGVASIAGTAAEVGTSIVLRSGATAILLADGRMSYDPAGAFDTLEDGQSAIESFDYTVADDEGATVSVTVTGVGDPVASGRMETGPVAAFATAVAGSVQASGGIVTGWTDDSGNGLDLTASDAPTLIAAGTPTGAAAISLDGAGEEFLDHILTASDPLPVGDEARSMYFVVDYGPSNNFAGAPYGAPAGNEASGL